MFSQMRQAVVRSHQQLFPCRPRPRYSTLTQITAVRQPTSIHTASTALSTRPSVPMASLDGAAVAEVSWDLMMLKQCQVLPVELVAMLAFSDPSRRASADWTRSACSRPQMLHAMSFSPGSSKEKYVSMAKSSTNQALQCLPRQQSVSLQSSKNMCAGEFGLQTTAQSYHVFNACHSVMTASEHLCMLSILTSARRLQTSLNHWPL